MADRIVGGGAIFEQATDPGAIGPGRLWLNTTTLQLNVRNVANSAWSQVSGGNVTDLIGRPVAGSISNITAAVAPSTILGFVGLVEIAVPINLHAINYKVAAAAVGTTGAVRVALYTNAGVLIAGTNATDAVAAADGAVVRTVTLGANVQLAPGCYYQFVCTAIAYGTTDPTIAAFTADDTFEGKTDILSGHVVCVAGAAPSPLGTITDAANSTPYFKLTGA